MSKTTGRPLAPAHVDPATKHPDLVDDVVSAVRGSGLFGQSTVTRHRFDMSFTAEEYATNLSTQSGIKELPPDAQAELLIASGAASRLTGEY